MVGLVIVSHSATLAEGAAELARQMGGSDVAIETAGGLEDGEIGTDAERVMAAIERVRSDDGVLVLMDLGSALMSAEIAVEMLGRGRPGALSGAPLIEGAVAAAARARTGAGLDEVATEARGALAMKTSQLGEEEPARRRQLPQRSSTASRLTLRVGIHSACTRGRQAASWRSRASIDVRLSLRNASRDKGPADARSLTALAMLQARQGDEVEATRRGRARKRRSTPCERSRRTNFGDPPRGGGRRECRCAGGAAAPRRGASGERAAGAARAARHRARQRRRARGLPAGS